MRVNIYDQSRLIGYVVDENAAKAWRNAVSYVKGMAHADGNTSPCILETPKGRVTFSQGIYTAVPEKKVR